MPDESTNDTGAAGGQRLHGDMLMGALLAFLKNSEAYGYELAARLEQAGLPSFDSSALYRMLRQLEATGMVSSIWDTSASGPARRMYSLTQTGELFLGSWMTAMSAFQNVITRTTEEMRRDTDPASAAATPDAPDPAAPEPQQEPTAG